MGKWKRSARLVDISTRLINHPYTLIPLTTFADKYQAAKSSISEDLSIVQEVFEKEGKGTLETVSGVAGGVRYIPRMKAAEMKRIIQELAEKLADPSRILAGGFLYMSDLLGDAILLQQLGRIWATLFACKEIDAIMTVETKGIPLAYAAATFLQVPVVIVRYDTRITEGSVVTVNTVSGSSRRMKQLSVAKRSLQQGAKVLIIDDFMKAGGTVRGMKELLKEFEAEVVGVAVMADEPVPERLIDSYYSLTTITQIQEQQGHIEVEQGNIFKSGGNFR